MRRLFLLLAAAAAGPLAAQTGYKQPPPAIAKVLDALPTPSAVISPDKAMMLMIENLKEEKAARRVERAIMQVTRTKLKSMAAGKMGYSTGQVGDLVVEALHPLPGGSDE